MWFDLQGMELSSTQIITLGVLTGAYREFQLDVELFVHKAKMLGDEEKRDPHEELNEMEKLELRNKINKVSVIPRNKT